MPHSLFKLSEKILNINNKNVERTTEVQNLTAKLKGVSNVPCKIRSLVEYTDTLVSESPAKTSNSQAKTRNYGDRRHRVFVPLVFESYRIEKLNG
ncbi:hypothetical protein V1477_020877 [Vespula maculifrons]|uniref:Uncharacterized protein n=1 Tax=Vespula maculifrons TaxID=7453 RepID=A0ABD2AN51_VESMC